MGDLYLVTGGTGFLGVSIVRSLLKRGSRVRVLARSGDAVLDKEAGVEIVRGCVTDGACVGVPPRSRCPKRRVAFRVLGAAGSSEANVRRINIEGTVNVVKSAAEHGGIKVVFASTSGTVAVSTSGDAVRGDADGYAEGLVRGWPYYHSKIVAEVKAREAAGRLNVPLVILRPSSILGPGEETLPTKKMLEYYRTKSIYKHISSSVPYVPAGGLNFVDVRDVTYAFIAAMDREEATGKDMLLGAPEANMTLGAYFERLEGLSGVKAQTRRVPYALAWVYIAARQRAAALAGKTYHVDPVVVEMANCFWYVDPSLARSVLGFEPRPIDQTLTDTLSYIASQGHAMGLPKGVPPMTIRRAKL